jgi:hypothetical protein
MVFYDRLEQIQLQVRGQVIDNGQEHEVLLQHHDFLHIQQNHIL